MTKAPTKIRQLERGQLKEDSQLGESFAQIFYFLVFEDMDLLTKLKI